MPFYRMVQGVPAVTGQVLESRCERTCQTFKPLGFEPPPSASRQGKEGEGRLGSRTGEGPHETTPNRSNYDFATCGRQSCLSLFQKLRKLRKKLKKGSIPHLQNADNGVRPPRSTSRSNGASCRAHSEPPRRQPGPQAREPEPSAPAATGDLGGAGDRPVASRGGGARCPRGAVHGSVSRALPGAAPPALPSLPLRLLPVPSAIISCHRTAAATAPSQLPNPARGRRASRDSAPVT